MPRFIRVLIVDDSALIRQMLTRALSMDPRIQIVGSAKTGVEAIERAQELNPDVITLDIEMPEMSGLEALPYIRKQTSARVVMLSSLSDADTVYRAMALGAVDFIPKPAGMATSITELAEQLLKTIKTVSRISPERASRALLEYREAECVDGETPGGLPCPPMRPGLPPSVCVAIAASTGGPPVLERIFSGLPAGLPASYVIVQHLPSGFSESLARRLSSAGQIEVTEAREGDVLEAGRGYLATHGRHLLVEAVGREYRFALSDEPSRHGVRPAADPLFESVAGVFGSNAMGVVLTGMGSDGAAGALCLRDAGAEVVAQNENTSVVWGMPGAAANAGATNRLVPAGLVAAEIRRVVRMRAEEGGGS